LAELEPFTPITYWCTRPSPKSCRRDVKQATLQIGKKP
jgi:hypothetical protein